jgi:hypothetical protein
MIHLQRNSQCFLSVTAALQPMLQDNLAAGDSVRSGCDVRMQPLLPDNTFSKGLRRQRFGYTDVTRDSLDSQTLLQSRQAPPMGRVLRILLGLVLMVYVTPVYFQVPVRVAVGSLLLMLGLIGIYSLIHIVVSRRIVAFGPFLGAIVANGLLVALYVAGASGLPILGHGKGQLAAVTFFGVSLVVAGVRAAPGCEVMAIPSLLFRKHTELACLIFSPLDRFERKLRSTRG